MNPISIVIAIVDNYKKIISFYQYCYSELIKLSPKGAIYFLMILTNIALIIGVYYWYKLRKAESKLKDPDNIKRRYLIFYRFAWWDAKANAYCDKCLAPHPKLQIIKEKSDLLFDTYKCPNCPFFIHVSKAFIQITKKDPIRAFKILQSDQPLTFTETANNVFTIE